MGIGRWLCALVAIGALACGRTELPAEGASPSDDGSASTDAPNSVVIDAETTRDAGSRDGSESDARSSGPDASLETGSPPPDASTDGRPSDAPTDTRPVDSRADAPDGYVSCGSGDIFLGDACVRQTCEPGDQGLECLTAGGALGHCMGTTCDNVDLFTDPENCGQFGDVCPAGATCTGGFCTNDGGAVDCLDCGFAPCGSGADYEGCVLPPATSKGFPGFCCGASCTDLLEDATNCGTCGHRCPGKAMCLDGVCDVDCSRSPENTPCYDTYGFCCGATCVLTFNDDGANCNACGASCPSAATCRDGSCSKDCATPGNACAAGQACIPIPPLTDDVCAPTTCSASADGALCAAADADGAIHPGSCCGETCEDLAVDAANCGACGHACPSGDACVAGTCVPSVNCSTASDSTPCVRAAGGEGLCCSGSCVDVETDDGNCTACGLSCPVGSVCRAASSEFSSAPCQDSGGTQQLCGAGNPFVVDSTNPCPPGFACTMYIAGRGNEDGLCAPTACTGIADGNACAVAANPAANSRCCGGVCVDIEGDPSNCGLCGSTCPAGSTCEDQSCLSTTTLRPLTCGPTAACPAGTFCDAAFVPGTGSSLPTLRRCLPRTCGALSDGDACAFGPDMVGTCCAGACVATPEDAANCGRCGASCGSGLCIDGACASSDVATCSPACAAGTICHRGVCYGPVCGDSAVCLTNDSYRLFCGGAPFCRAQDGDLGFCCADGSCVDEANDPNNCGGCGVRCGGGTCVNGSCTGTPCGYATEGEFCGDATDADSVCCGAACVRTDADDANCGACGTVCPSGTKCAGGTCQ